MPNSFFTFNNKDCRQWNCYKTQPINWITPERDIERKPVPGRNGDLIIDNGRYNNIELTIECYIKGDFIRLYDSMRAYLMSDTEYHRFIDSLYPNEYRMVRIVNVEAKVKTKSAGTVEITIDAKPQRYFLNSVVAQIGGVIQPDTTYSFSDFTSWAQNEILSTGAFAGYTSAELSALKYTIFDANGVTFAEGDTVEFIGSGADPFFFCNFSGDPTSATGGASSGASERYIKVSSLGFSRYIVRPYEFNARILLNGTMINTLRYVTREVYNPTNYNAKPLIRVKTLKQVVNDYIGGINNAGIYLNIPSPYADTVEYITIDTETLDAYSLPADNDFGYFINCNKYVRYTDTLEYIPGDNEILANGLIAWLNITPNWWSL